MLRGTTGAELILVGSPGAAATAAILPSADEDLVFARDLSGEGALVERDREWE